MAEIDKDHPAILDLIARYKVHLRTHGLKDELYKWELIGRFKGRPNPEAADFAAEVAAVQFGNLPYQMGLKGMKDLVRERPEGYRACLRQLFDPTVDVTARIARFSEDTLQLYREFYPQEKFGHYQDERMAGVLLAFHDPDRYAIYKDSFYKKFCKLLGIAHKWKGEKYAHFQLLIQDFVRLYVSQDKELLEMMARALPPEVYQDRNHLLLAQNILYTVLDQGKGIELPDEEDQDHSPTTSKNMNPSKYPLNQILYGPPGTGKTYRTIDEALKILGVKGKDREADKKLFQAMLEAGRIAFTTFHQSMSYEDFVEGIKPVMDKDQTEKLGFKVEDGILMQIASDAEENYDLSRKEWKGDLSFEDALEELLREFENGQEVRFELRRRNKAFKIHGYDDGMLYVKVASGGIHWLRKKTLRKLFYGTTKVHEDRGTGIYYTPIVKKLKEYQTLVPSAAVQLQNFVLIIDEINRGNVSQIFGELITLIEEDKRAGAPEALSVTLPYSKDTFSVPPNLYIIGTMNTADRSVEALDTALRRRFTFKEIAPDPELVPEALDDATDISPRAILRTINARIEKLLDRDHMIGHAYFMGKVTLPQLKDTFQHKLLPLLQEYFYGDYAKIGLVLGKGFVMKAETEGKAKAIFADFAYDYKDDLADREVWHLADMEKMEEDDFRAALAALMNRSAATA